MEKLIPVITFLYLHNWRYICITDMVYEKLLVCYNKFKVVGLSYRECQINQFRFPECLMDLSAGSLAAQHHSHNGTGRGAQWDNTPLSPEPRLYMVSFTKVARLVGFPVEGFKHPYSLHAPPCAGQNSDYGGR